MKKNSALASWPAMLGLGIALLAAYPATVLAEPWTAAPQTAPAIDPSADIQEMATLYHTMQTKLQGIHDRASADAAAEWLQTNRTKWSRLIAGLDQILLPSALEAKKIQIQYNTRLLLQQYTTRFTVANPLTVSDTIVKSLEYNNGLMNPNFYGSDKLMYALYDCFTPVNGMDQGMYNTPPVYEQLSTYYGFVLRSAESMLDRITDKKSADETATSLHKTLPIMQECRERLQALTPFPRLNDEPAIDDGGYIPRIRKHIVRLSETNYHGSTALKLTCETMFLPPSSLADRQELLARQEFDLYLTILNELTVVHDAASAENVLHHIQPWLQKLDSIQRQVGMNDGIPEPYAEQIMTPRCQQMREYGSTLTDTYFRLQEKQYYGSHSLQTAIESLIRNLPTHAELYRHELNDAKLSDIEQPHPNACMQ